MLAGTHRGKAAFDLPGGLVDGGGHPANLIQRCVFHTSLQISLLDADGDVHDALESARRPDRSRSRNPQGDQKCNRGTPKQTPMDLRLYRRDIRQRVGKAHRASGHGSRHI